MKAVKNEVRKSGFVGRKDGQTVLTIMFHWDSKTRVRPITLVGDCADVLSKLEKDVEAGNVPEIAV